MSPRLLILALIATASMSVMAIAASPLPPATLKINPPHASTVTYGPADMMCDRDKCHMFLVPGFPKNSTVDFQMPFLNGQNRTDLQRCFNVCKVSVLGYVSDVTGHPTPDQRNPSITITPIEIRLQ